MVFPKPTELAILTVNGAKFQDWESVNVSHALRDRPPYKCKFTCSERLPISKNLNLLQIKPGDACTVTLAGQPAFSGLVETRQVYYDAQRHHIEIQCATLIPVATSSVINQTMTWRNKTFQEIATDVLTPLGIQLKFEGGAPPSQKFDRVAATPGESSYDFLDKLARSLSSQDGAGISFTTNIGGDFVVVMGPLQASDRVVEGESIIIGRELIYNPAAVGKQPALVQGTGSDKKNMADVSHVPFFQETVSLFGGGDKAIPSVIRQEIQTSDQSVLKGRAGTEGQWLGVDQITVWATVNGWLRPTGGLWLRDQLVSVTSPMLMMDNKSLILKSIQFTQDNQTGTRSTLELCNPQALGKQNPALAS